MRFELAQLLRAAARDRYLTLDFEPPPRGSSDPPRLVVPDRWAKAPQLTLGVDAATLHAELTVTEYTFDARGRYRVTPKDRRRRG